MSCVGQDIVRHSTPTAHATSGRGCVEQYSSAPTKDWSCAGLLSGDSDVDELGQIIARWRVVAVERRRYAAWKERGQQMRDIVLLPQ
eukprot:6175844-Pleurochrysis_carterae.AAC.5